MAKGLLTFTGTIDLNQFWPKNINGKSPYDSDADTVKVKVDIASIQFATGAGKVKKTKALNNAGFWKNVKKSNGTVVKKFFPVINSNNIVTIRLQGIDAPELHYDTGKTIVPPEDFIALSDAAEKAKRNIWKYVSYQMARMDRNLIHVKKDGSYSAADDKKNQSCFRNYSVASGRWK